MPLVDFEEHKTRYRTLQAIARQYATHPERFGIVKVWRHKSDLQTNLELLAENWDTRLQSEIRP